MHSDVHIAAKSLPACAMLPKIAWPVVEFVRSKHATGPYHPKTLIAQMSVDVTNAQGSAEATRHQVPLILAWYVLSLLSFTHLLIS